MSQFEQGPFVPFEQSRPEDIDPGLLLAFTDYTERYSNEYKADVSEVMVAIANIIPPDPKEIQIDELPETTLTNSKGVKRIMGFDFTTDAGYKAFTRFACWLPQTSIFEPSIIGRQSMRHIPRAKISGHNQHISVACAPVATVPVIDPESGVRDGKYPIFMRQLTTPIEEASGLHVPRPVLGVELAFVHPLVFAYAPKPEFVKAGSV